MKRRKNKGKSGTLMDWEEEGTWMEIPSDCLKMGISDAVTSIL